VESFWGSGSSSGGSMCQLVSSTWNTPSLYSWINPRSMPMLCLLGVSRPSFAGFVSHGYLRSESYSIPGSEARAYLNIKGPALYEAVCRRMMAVPQTRSAQHADFDTAENYISAPSVPTDTKVQFRFDMASPSYSGCPQVRSTTANHRKRATRQTSAFS